MQAIPRAVALAVTAGALGATLGAGSAPAATTPTCHAGILRATVAGLPAVALGQAGTPGGRCADVGRTVNLDADQAVGPLRLTATTGTLGATTVAAPTTGHARIDNASVAVGGLTIAADAIDARAGGCVGHYSTSGSVTNLRVNGTTVLSDRSVPTPLGPALVQLNRATVTAQGASRDAVTVQVAGVVTVTLGHAEAAHGTVCSGSSGGSGGSGTSSRPNNGSHASSCARLRMWFVPRNVRNTRRYLTHPGPRTVTGGVEHGVHRVTRGRIVNCKGRPIGHARIDVYHVVKGHKLRKTGIRSRRNGLLTLVLQSNLHTRDIVFEYRPNTHRHRVASRSTLVKVMRRHGHRIY